MKTFQKFTIAGGNTTMFISGIPYSPKTATKYLANVEQIGFIKDSKIPTLTMMGKELSINGTIAFASTLKKQGYLITSGIKNKIKYLNNNDITTITIPINYKRLANIILLEGIGYVITNSKVPNLKKYLNNLCIKYKYPAFGKIEFKNNQIVPFVYVKQTQSLVQETACGSGSLSFYILSNFNTILQPTKQSIQIKSDDNYFYISTNVNKIE